MRPAPPRSALRIPPPAQDTTFVVRDSVGVRITESFAPLWTPDTEWRLSEDPVVRFGGDREPGDPYLFRVSAARRLPDGGFLLANHGTDLRRYDSRGRLLWSTLNIEENPRPIQAMASIDLRPGDSIGVFNLKVEKDDESSARYSIYSADGRVQRVITVQTDGIGVWRPVGSLSDGSVVAAIFPETSLHNGVGRYRLIDTLVRSSPSTPVLDTLGSFAGAERFRVEVEPGVAMVSSDPPFQHQRFEDVRGTDVLIAFTERFEFQVRDTLGQLREIVRRPLDARPVTQQDRDEWKGRMAQMGRSDAFLEAMIFSDTHPLLDELLVDTNGNVWIRHARPEKASGPLEWTVFGRDGRWLGSIWTPEHLVVLEIGSDYVLGMLREPDAPQWLELYPLIKP